MEAPTKAALQLTRSATAPATTPASVRSQPRVASATRGPRHRPGHDLPSEFPRQEVRVRFAGAQRAECQQAASGWRDVRDCCLTPSRTPTCCRRVARPRVPSCLPRLTTGNVLTPWRSQDRQGLVVIQNRPSQEGRFFCVACPDGTPDLRTDQPAGGKPGTSGQLGCSTDCLAGGTWPSRRIRARSCWSFRTWSPFQANYRLARDWALLRQGALASTDAVFRSFTAFARSTRFLCCATSSPS